MRKHFTACSDDAACCISFHRFEVRMLRVQRCLKSACCVLLCMISIQMVVISSTGYRHAITVKGEGWVDTLAYIDSPVLFRSSTSTNAFPTSMLPRFFFYQTNVFIYHVLQPKYHSCICCINTCIYMVCCAAMNCNNDLYLILQMFFNKLLSKQNEIPI